MISDEAAKKLIRGMFEDGILDPYPASDGDPTVQLRKWCGYGATTPAKKKAVAIRPGEWK